MPQSSRAMNSEAGHFLQQRKFFGRDVYPKYHLTKRKKLNDELVCKQRNLVQWDLAGVQ